jgi:hypothetical protein
MKTRGAETLVDLTLVKHHSTGAAILVSETGDRSKAVWLPNTQIEEHMTAKTEEETGNDFTRSTRPVYKPVVEVTLPEWLAVDKGLV